MEMIQPLDDFPLPPRDKVYIYKNFAVPKMRWVLLVQDVGTTLHPQFLRQRANATALQSMDHFIPQSTTRGATG